MKEPKILYISPNRDFSGYATASRHYIAALDSVGCNVVTRSLVYDGGGHKQTEREKFLQSKDLQNVQIVVNQTTPNESSRRPDLFSCQYFAWETDRVPDEWVAELNKMDLVLVPCDENVKAAKRSGVTVPVEKVEHAFNPEDYKGHIKPFLVPGADYKFKMLSICQLSKKKGIDVLLKTYFTEFAANENVLLILKVYFGPNDTEEHKQAFIAQVNKIKELLRLPAYPRVHIIHEVLEEEMMPRLYRTADCYVGSSRGEGWSITHFDAMGHGLPPIATGWGGPPEFITPECGWLIDYHMSPCFDMPHPHPFMYTARDNWAEPHVDSLRLAMREAYNEWGGHQINPEGSRWSQRIEKCKERVNDFSYEVIGKKYRDVLYKHYYRWKESQ